MRRVLVGSQEVPDRILIVREVPYTVSGKKVEIALANPEPLEQYVEIAQLLRDMEKS